MDIRIGVQNVAREVALETDASADEVTAQVTEALQNKSLLRLTGAKGETVLIPAEIIGYMELGKETSRPVGFAAGH